MKTAILATLSLSALALAAPGGYGEDGVTDVDIRQKAKKKDKELKVSP
ncbi:hypothetical protein JCM10213_008286, partial [Rhodosporidiobolus nylandii]